MASLKPEVAQNNVRYVVPGQWIDGFSILALVADRHLQNLVRERDPSRLSDNTSMILIRLRHPDGSENDNPCPSPCTSLLGRRQSGSDFRHSNSQHTEITK